jgi:hypothetical protein
MPLTITIELSDLMLEAAADEAEPGQTSEQVIRSQIQERVLGPIVERRIIRLKQEYLNLPIGNVPHDEMNEFVDEVKQVLSEHTNG